MPWRDALGDFVFVTVRAFEQTHRSDGREQPRKFRDFRNVGLLEENGFFWVKAAREKIQRHVQSVFATFIRVEERGHGMIIRNEIKRLALFLKLDGGAHHPEVISEMQRAAGLDA